jgi:hypothetical protein
MLNEEKVRDMTALAIFEKNEGRKIFPVNGYFKGDYVGGQMLRSFFGYTFCFLLLFSLWLLYRLDEILGGVAVEEMFSWGARAGLIYGTGLAIYLAITWYIYSRRYDHAVRSQVMYASKLRHLMKKYGKDKPERPRNNRGGRE